MVRNAIKRAWKSDDGLSVTLCNDEQKDWVRGLAEETETTNVSSRE